MAPAVRYVANATGNGPWVDLFTESALPADDVGCRMRVTAVSAQADRRMTVTVVDDVRRPGPPGSPVVRLALSPWCCC